jgi:hypothetical protein
MPPHPSLIPRIPMRYTAEITTRDGWWFRYRVNRLHGIGIPEKSVSVHRSLKGAQRAARRELRRNDREQPQVIERYGEDQ